MASLVYKREIGLPDPCQLVPDPVHRPPAFSIIPTDREPGKTTQDKALALALSTSMEFSVIPRRIQTERFIPLECFRKEGNTFQGIPFFSLYRNSRKFMYHAIPYHQVLHGNTSEKECLRSDRRWQISKTFIDPM